MRLSLTLALGLVAAGPLLADNWPQWRGPKNDGHSAETGLPAEFGPDKNLVWKAKLPGLGESSPVVWDDKIFLTAMAGNEAVLLCIGTDGQEKWRKSMATVGTKRYGPDQATSASSSPTTDGKHVWAYAGGLQGGQLKCFDLAGNLVWEKNLQNYGKFNIQFGTHWTPVLYKGKLYLQVLHRSAQKLVKLDAATGDQEWAVDRRGAVPAKEVPSGGPESPDVYASAFIWEGDGGPLLISHGNDYCTAHKLDDGAEVWRVMGLNPTDDGHWRFVSSPLVTPDLIVVPSCKNGPTVGVNPVGANGEIDKKNPAELWRVKPRAIPTPDVVSPLRVADVVYLMGDGPLTAVEAKTGQPIYTYDLTKGRHRSNMVCVDDKIYIAAVDGAVDVIRAGGREAKVLARNTLQDKLFASPAVAGGRIYFRGYENLWAVGMK
jgi:outer membrane protein assembly factor BamB